MTSLASGGTLNPPRPWQPPRRIARTTCKACGSSYPTGLVLAGFFPQHLSACRGRSLSVALDNLRRWADRPPAGYIVDQELALIKRRLAA